MVCSKHVTRVFYVSLLAGLMPALAQAELHHYLVLNWHPESGLTSNYHRLVDLPAAEDLEKSEKLAPPYAEIFDDKGALLSRIPLAKRRFVRAEFAGHHEPAVQFENPAGVAFVVRVPASRDARIWVDDGAKQQRSYRVSDLAAAAIRQDLTEPTVSKGPSSTANRLNLLVTGDGYTTAEQTKFEQDAQTLAAAFLADPPYVSYAGLIEVETFFVASAQSGADHPKNPCEDGTEDLLAPLFVDTAFDATYCAFGIHRLLDVDDNKVLAAAAGVPDWDAVFVVVNDDTFGGSGGGVPAVSTSSFAKDILVHEFGHSFTQLADEYEIPFPTFPDCTDLGGGAGPCEPNITDETNRAALKWGYLVEAGTPIPTPDLGFADKVGLFEGGRYQSMGKFRPQLDCNMRSLGGPFCAVCNEAFVVRLYAGGWGVPAAGISLIEPGSEVPVGSSATAEVGVASSFSIQPVMPSHGVTIRWLVDGQEQLGETGPSLSYTAGATGVVQITVEVTDPATLLLPASVSLLPVFSQSWSVTVSGMSDVLFADGFES